jgi:ABC-type transport system involved in multi-copper enzyme maturation permease subunit
MYFVENPVLQRELVANLRQGRSFLLLAGYLSILGAVVYVAWPTAKKIDMTNPEAAQRLVNLVFLGQYLIASLVTPSFAAGSITGEKERKSYEMLLASPLAPAAIVLGKLLASLCHVMLLVFCSVPIVMLCLPLGGVSFFEVLGLYWALLLSVLMYGMISVACSSYFQRTSAALVVSYLLILPLALVGVWFWSQFAGNAAFRLFITAVVLPAGLAVVGGSLFVSTSRRLLHPPDVGSEGREVVDEEQEVRQAVGMVIQRNEFPDRLFAPPKRTDLLEDGSNPIFDKEMRSELFSQGTLMLRLVIQVSMFLSLPLMAVCLFYFPHLVPWYLSYVIFFNMLVSPVFLAGSVTSERERETLDLLLVTMLSPWQIVWGKLLSGLRISSVLTAFLLWPLLLAAVLVSYYWGNMPTLGAYLVIILVTCLTTAEVALACSVVFQKTAVSMLVSYLLLAGLFAMPPAVAYFADTFFAGTNAAEWIERLTFPSPFSAAFSLPLAADDLQTAGARPAHWYRWWAFVGVHLALDLALLAGMLRMFRYRWLEAGRRSAE